MEEVSQKKITKKSVTDKSDKGGLELSKYSEQELLQKAQDEIDKLQLPEAEKYCQEVLKRNPDSLEALEFMASLCIDTAKLDNAKLCLQHAITLAPDEGYSKYFSMGQLLEGKEALQCYKKGIDILEKLVKSDSPKKVKKGRAAKSQSKKNNRPKSDPLSRKLSSAYCAVAEIYTSDLCDEDEAETECEKYIKTAIKADKSNPEGFQQYANFFLIKGEEKKAKTMMLNSLYLWLPYPYQAISETDIDDKELLPEQNLTNSIPLSASTRLAAAKILIELKLYEEAEDVIEDVIGENDADAYTWYLLGLVHYFQGSEHMEEAKLNFLKAIELHSTNPCSEEGIIDHMNELLQSEELLNVFSPPQSDEEEWMNNFGDLSNLDDFEDMEDENEDDSDDMDEDDSDDMDEDDSDLDEDDSDLDEDDSDMDDDGDDNEIADKEITVKTSVEKP